jgi:type I restriction enzyme R subunit
VLALNEADTCRKFVVPALQAQNWDSGPHSIHEQATVTDGRIVPVGEGFVRRRPKKVDYLLRYRRDFPIAVVEAKASYKSPAEGLEQAKDYAQLLGLKFAYATNGKNIIEFDFIKGTELEVSTYPTPEELWKRYNETLGDLSQENVDRLLEPCNIMGGKAPRYYQTIAINRTVEAVLTGQKRILLTMATGTGKTNVAFQICWKLWKSKWNALDQKRKPRILFLADLNLLIDHPKDGMFSAFGDARHKITSGEIVESREMYFAIYQAIAEDENRVGIFREYAKDFFDIIVIDECHRGSAREDSSWRVILEHFSSAVQIGLTATPVRKEAADTYKYFGEPIYQYSLRQGIEDGFLAPYKVHRVITAWDAAGWRPSVGDIDRFGREIPDDEYSTKDFERVISLRARTKAIAKHLYEFMEKSDPLAKTIVFCVDQEHALDMRQELINLNSANVSKYPDFVCRVTSNEGDIGKGHLEKFQDLDSASPVILTTSKLLTTGIDAPTVKNVVLARVIGSMTEFKQIIGRGTRVRDDYGKLWFNIIDYTGSATRLFADPAFDGDPTTTIECTIDVTGEETSSTVISTTEENPPELGTSGTIIDPPTEERIKYYFDGGSVNIVADLVYELDVDGNQLRVIKYSQYAADTVRSLYPTPPELQAAWNKPDERDSVVLALLERGISFEALAQSAGMPEADPLDLLCHLAFNAPLRTRRERAQKLTSTHPELFLKYGDQAKEVLEALLEKYARFGDEEFKLPDVLHVDPLRTLGMPAEIAKVFGGAENLQSAITELRTLLYAE